jgi:hypothetical protein
LENLPWSDVDIASVDGTMLASVGVSLTAEEAEHLASTSENLLPLVARFHLGNEAGSGALSCADSNPP